MLGPSYTPFADLLTMLNSPIRGWAKSHECDRWIKVIAHQIYMSAPGTKANRILAISQWALIKKQAAAPAFMDYGAQARLAVTQHTLTNALTARNNGQSALNKAGKLSRALNACMNELNVRLGKEAAYQIWLNNITVALLEANNFSIPPAVLPVLYYQVNEGGWQEVTATIALSAGDRFELQAFGIGYDSIQWNLDGSPVGNPGEEFLLISSVAAGDAGDYICTYSRAGEDADSPTATVTVT